MCTRDKEEEEEEEEEEELDTNVRNFPSFYKRREEKEKKGDEGEKRRRDRQLCTRREGGRKGGELRNEEGAICRGFSRAKSLPAN